MIEAHGLSRSFSARGTTIDAVSGVDLHMAEGEIVGFLEPNGAGKTTTLRMLTTLLAPTSGSARVAGHDLRREPIEVRRRIGYVGQGGCTDPEARVGEELVDQALLYGISADVASRRAHGLLGQLELPDTWKRRTKTLSGGQRRRLDVAMCLIHEPRLLFLDEPATGLDPQACANMWEHVRSLRDERGATVFLTKHYLEEADALCDRVLIIDGGRIVAEGAPEELRRRTGGDSVILTLRDDVSARRAADLLGMFAGVGRAEASECEVRLDVAEAHETLERLLGDLTESGIELAGLEVRRPNRREAEESLRRDCWTGAGRQPKPTHSAHAAPCAVHAACASPSPRPDRSRLRQAA
jgi:ABC-2 type transport system ATP-binding protein